jgi:hypothetical protein
LLSFVEPAKDFLLLTLNHQSIPFISPTCTRTRTPPFLS